jgi:outer membrane receptor protein involved in Fe transport
LFSDDDISEFNGTLEWPMFNADLYLAYTLNDWRLAYGINWVDSMDSYDYLEEAESNSIYDFEVPSYIEHRISMRYQATDWEATFGIRNLTNEIPPSISFGYYNRVGNAPLYSGYDYVGREAFINVQYRFN